MKTHLHNIYYSKLNNETYRANCIDSSNNLSSAILSCYLPHNVYKPEYIFFGLGINLISKQTIQTIMINFQHSLCLYIYPMIHFEK